MIYAGRILNRLGPRSFLLFVGGKAERVICWLLCAEMGLLVLEVEARRQTGAAQRG